MGDLFKRNNLSPLDSLKVSTCRDRRPPPAKAGYRSRSLEGVGFTAPYLHNNSVPTLDDLLKPAAQRPKKFYVGCNAYDVEKMGYKCYPYSENAYLIDTSIVGNRNMGHEYGTKLSPGERKDLIAYINSLEMPQKAPRLPISDNFCGEL